MSCLSDLDGFRDGRQVTVQMLSCGMLPPGFVQNSSCVIAIKLFLCLLSVHVVYLYS